VFLPKKIPAQVESCRLPQRISCPSLYRLSTTFNMNQKASHSEGRYDGSENPFHPPQQGCSCTQHTNQPQPPHPNLLSLPKASPTPLSLPL